MMFSSTQKPETWRELETRFLSNHLWRKQITQFRKWDKDLGVSSADLGRGKGKHTTKKKKSHECRKTSRIWKTFPSADLELDKERSQELFTLSVLLHRGEKVQVCLKYRNIWTSLSPSYASTDHLN